MEFYSLEGSNRNSSWDVTIRFVNWALSNCFLLYIFFASICILFLFYSRVLASCWVLLDCWRKISFVCFFFFFFFFFFFRCVYIFLGSVTHSFSLRGSTEDRKGWDEEIRWGKNYRWKWERYAITSREIHLIGMSWTERGCWLCQSKRDRTRITNFYIGWNESW